MDKFPGTNTMTLSHSVVESILLGAIMDILPEGTRITNFRHTTYDGISVSFTTDPEQKKLEVVS